MTAHDKKKWLEWGEFQRIHIAWWATQKQRIHFKNHPWIQWTTAFPLMIVKNVKTISTLCTKHMVGTDITKSMHNRVRNSYPKNTFSKVHHPCINQSTQQPTKSLWAHIACLQTTKQFIHIQTQKLSHAHEYHKSADSFEQIFIAFTATYKCEGLNVRCTWV